MKFSCYQTGRLCLSLVLTVMISSCNPDEYFPSEELIAGADAYCSSAVDLNSCQAMADICQPAYNESENEFEEPEFAVCVANRDLWNPNYADIPTVVESDPTADPVDDSTATVPVDDSAETVPTLTEAYESKCKNLDEQYFWVKTVVKKNKVVGQESKVKVCHFTGNGSAHTIVIACPALKAHLDHGDDYLGVCVY